MKLAASFFASLCLLAGLHPVLAAVTQIGTACTVTPLSPTPVPPGGRPPDDTPQFRDAYSRCGRNGSITFTEGNFYIGQVMDVTLQNCEINILGTITWSTDIQYWLRNSIAVTYAQRHTAWRISGTNIAIRGHGKGLLFGNGQTWYDQNRNQGNQMGRPISLTIWRANNVFIDGLTWRQPQFWNTFVAYSQNVTMTNLDMEAKSNSQWTTVNTDGTNIWNSRDIYISNWTVYSGDDCICAKGNTTNMHVKDITCYESGGMVVGSIGSVASQPDFVEHVLFENVRLNHSSNAAWIKTYPGQGYVNNVTFRNIQFSDVNQPIYITSCIYSGQNCDSSRLNIRNVRWENITGTSRYNVGAGMHCSASSPCQNLTFTGIDIRQFNGGGPVKNFCSNIANQATMGLRCDGPCPGNWPQQLNGNR
ncbi:exo-rhamnogalacturonase B [Coprinopsis cinerea okayama7|uniref:galacturonan 1,4-alpha-galacturonidase n=1 Tax=Coprinopsis cinerea (strain Okayama-7 / 130 / ATCC MYA-4618 / FGSC 9003) TaxID=240176 RepID=A8NHU8_COPC7|nr:exo-rhamnogalacturonase B [Coprinopsis cinerea okayama7\|eukprot:XP_001833832.2 exo-rhamnogalacturonase B [Coprinopsis cinerea okayama7\